MESDKAEVVKRLLRAFRRADFETALDLIDAGVRVFPRPDEPVSLTGVQLG